MHINISTTQYQFAHGKKPRGIGSWVFKINNVLYHNYGTYSQAKNEAIRAAKEIAGGNVFMSGEVLS